MVTNKYHYLSMIVPFSLFEYACGIGMRESKKRVPKSLAAYQVTDKWFEGEAFILIAVVDGESTKQSISLFKQNRLPSGPNSKASP